jgi:hypothetical protein
MNEPAYEYAPFGDSIVRRPAESTDPWETVPPEDLEDARVEVRVAAKLKAQRRGMTGKAASRVIRSERNEKVAKSLGLNAGELAERLARPDDNRGTKLRVSEEDFDSYMGELGLSPEEARARFKGTYWTGEPSSN